MKKYAWYFPNWHVTELNEKWHGKGWTEWECVKYATPRFEGHVQPKVPLWGYEDESDPVVFEKKIKTALDYGIDGFIFDFYWFSCGPYRRDCLDKGFLGAPNNEDCEFSIMWANHDPVYVHPAPYMHSAPELLSGIVDKDLFKEVTQFCIDNYFWRKNYQRVNGKIFYGVWDVVRMVKEFGSLEECAKVFEDFRERARKAGHELFLAAANKNLFPGFKEKDKELFEKTVDALGIEMVMTYSWPNIYPKEGWPAIEYAEAREEYFKTVPEDVEFCKVPFCIAASTGWDSSPRTVQSDKYEDSGYPYLPIQVNNTPDEVEKTFRMCKEWIESGKVTGDILTISTWNEWTEGNYMEPDEQYGYGFLEAFKKVFSE